MNENLNLVEILKDCPEGTKLYSPVLGEVDFVKISDDDTSFPIKVRIEYRIYTFSSQGRFCNIEQGECLLFPSREQRDWSKFKPKKPMFYPKTFQPFDKVLVKKGDKSYNVWFPDFISLPPNDVDETILCLTIDDVVMAIPYNEETKHLIGTNKEAPEFYRYWED